MDKFPFIPWGGLRETSEPAFLPRKKVGGTVCIRGSRGGRPFSFPEISEGKPPALPGFVLAQ
jgi:hypothetical protein